MKKIIIAIFFSLIFSSVLIISCKKVDYAPIGESITLEKNLIGNFKLDSVIQVDQNAVDKGFPAYVQKLNITSLFPYNTLSVVFTDGGTGNTGTYAFTNPGNAPIFVAPSGNWTIIENGGPVRVKLSNGTRSDTLDFAKAFSSAEKKLALRYNRAFYTGTKKVFLYYDFNFSKN